MSYIEKVKIFGYYNGTTWTELACDEDGHLIETT
jgi:hypothetical protein